MKNPNYKGIELLPLSVIKAARAGDAEAVERVLRYYEGYINKLCTRTLYDEYGQPHVCVDEYMKRRLEIKLISCIDIAPFKTAYAILLVQYYYRIGEMGIKRTADGISSTGISPRPMLVGAPRNALRAFNAGVSLAYAPLLMSCQLSV